MATDRCAPAGIFSAHAADQRTNLRWHGRASGLASPHLSGPELPECLPVPCNHRVGLHDLQRRAPLGPPARKRYPKEAIGMVQGQAFHCRPLQNSDLVAQRNVFQLESSATFIVDETTAAIIAIHSNFQRKSLWNVCNPRHPTQFDIYENYNSRSVDARCSSCIYYSCICIHQE
jgi:hypothetical protein